MNNTPMKSLYELLPAIHKIDDEKTGGQLKAFLSVIQEQINLLKANIDQSYSDLFIETCDEWVIPYIGDLVGNRPLYEILRTRRRDVARTLYYRRRKGTLPALEELARDVTGWSVHAVAFFELLAWTQNLNHRRESGKIAALRNFQLMDLFDGPFDKTAHTLDIRKMETHIGWHHPRRVGFFAWRLNNYHVEGSLASREAAPNAHGYHFSPFGLKTQLFQRPEDLTVGNLTEERHLRQQIRSTAFFADASLFCDPTITPTVHKHDGKAFGPPISLVPMDLSEFAQPQAGSVGIDSSRGLISFATDEIPVQAGVAYHKEGPRLAEQLSAPNDHVFRFSLLNLEIWYNNNNIVPVAAHQYMDLSSWARPQVGRVGIDLGLGRISFGNGEEPDTDIQTRFGTSMFVIAAQANTPNAHGYHFQLPTNVSSLRITRNGAPIPAFQLFCMHLLHWERPPALRVGIDLEMGRISFPSGEEPVNVVVVSYDYGFLADLGGGPYDRLAPTKPGETVVTISTQALREPKQFHRDDEAMELYVGLDGFATINDALDIWRGQNRPNCTITVQDNRTYSEDIILDTSDQTLVLQAANHCRPVILGKVLIDGGNGNAALILSGLWMNSPLSVEGDLKQFVISHCTVAANQHNSVFIANTNKSVKVTVERSIIGDLNMPPESSLTLSDSIVLNIQCAGVATIERATILDAANFHEISLISECIFIGNVNISRRQSGCLRFSYLPSASQTPQRYRCQPDLALEGVHEHHKSSVEIRVIPTFTSVAYGEAGYGQLSVMCPKEISAGGEDGGEMGAFQFLQQGRREANFYMRMNEYLPFGLRAGIIYVN